MNKTLKKVALCFLALVLLGASILFISYQQDMSRAKKTLAECIAFEDTFKRVSFNFNEIIELKSQLKSGSLTESDAYSVRGQLIDYDARIKELLGWSYKGDIDGATSDEIVYYQHGIEKAMSEEVNLILAANNTVFRKFGETHDNRFPEIYIYYQWLDYLSDNEQGNLTIFKESFE